MGVRRPLLDRYLTPPGATPQAAECGFGSGGLPGTAGVPVANAQSLAT